MFETELSNPKNRYVRCYPEAGRLERLPAGYCHHYIPLGSDACACGWRERDDVARGFTTTGQVLLPGEIVLDEGDREIRTAAYPVSVHRKEVPVMATTAPHTITHRTVPISELWLEAEHFSNPRQFTGLESGAIEELGEDIRLKGIVDPPKVQKILVDGKIVNLVVDGQRRVLAGRAVLPKNAQVPVVDLDEDAVELTPEIADKLLDKALTSLRHEGLSSFELSAVAEGMQKRGRTLEVIGVSIGKSKSWVSRMLKARSTATPKLMIQWKKGDVTDEQFKELAEVKDPDKQVEAAKEVVEARKSGDKAEARVRSKESKESARATAVPEKITKPAVSGEQHELFQSEAEADAAINGKPAEIKAPKPAVVKGPSRLVLEEFIGLAAKRPPTSDYVKGIMDGVRYATGAIDPDKFGKAWAQYLARIEGRPAPKKSKAKAVKKPAPKKSKEAKPTKAKKSRR